MENKINIAELLKDYPKGMELDCMIWDNVVFDEVDSEDPNYPIGVRIKNGAMKWLTADGKYDLTNDAKCVIFPKGKTSWEGFTPPCNFKDRDIVATSKGDCVFMLKKVISYGSNNICNGTCYFGLGLETKTLLTKEANWYFSRLATEEEKAELVKAIKENGFKWNEETKKLEKEYQYPQTFEECCTVLGLTELGIIGGYKRGLLTAFRNLLICRDAYWQIAGDWKFDFDAECYFPCNRLIGSKRVFKKSNKKFEV